MDGTLHTGRPWRQTEGHGSTNHARPGAHAPQLHRPHLKCARNPRRSTEVHVQTAGRHDGTAYTVYTWARYGDLPAPIWHPDPSWHQPLHRRRVPRQSIKPEGNTVTGTHGNPPPLNIINSALANARMPVIDTGCPTPDDTTHRRTWGTIRRALHHDIDRDQAIWIDQGSVNIRVGGWLNTLNPKKLRMVAGPYILYPVPHGMNGPCPGLRPGDPLAATPAPTPCSHHCPHNPPHSQLYT